MRATVFVLILGNVVLPHRYFNSTWLCNWCLKNYNTEEENLNYVLNFLNERLFSSLLLLTLPNSYIITIFSLLFRYWHFAVMTATDFKEEMLSQYITTLHLRSSWIHWWAASGGWFKMTIAVKWTAPGISWTLLMWITNKLKRFVEKNVNKKDPF